MSQFTRIASSFVAVSVLTEPITFRNGKKAGNRIMKAPLTEKLFDWSEHSIAKRGIPSQSIQNLYTKWGHGGFGLIVTGSFVVDPKYVSEAGQGIICQENTNANSEKKLGALARALKSDGALAIAQLSHPGAKALRDYTDSDNVKHELNDNVEDPATFSKDRIQDDVVSRFAYSALVLHKNGFDGVELLAAHGNIFNQFLAPKTSRTDAYGGSFENRARLLFDTVNAIRRVVPEDSGFLVGVKLNSRDFQDFEESKKEVIRLCELIEAAGVDFVEITGGMMEMTMTQLNMRVSTAARENYFADFVKETSRIFKNTAVYITGGWQTAGSMVSSVEMGLAKGIGLARWSASEPDFPKKLLAGEISSCPNNQFPPFDFWYQKNAALWQMRSLSETEYDETKGPSHGVTNFTVKEECENFKKTCDDFKTKADAMGGINNHMGVLDYEPLES